ncbi:nicotinamide mononucleotide transporter family protein [bacterium]|nr:nicotinamide mononucleotide transporter family protein [bacterium]
MWIITWSMTLLSIIGVILNIKKKRICFVLWSITNVSWCIYDFTIQAYAQSFLFLVYLGLSIWGIFEWKKERIKQ